MKSSTAISLVLLATVSVVGLRTCAESNDDETTPEIVDATDLCMVAAGDANCRTEMDAARHQHEAIASKFATREACERTFGPDGCVATDTSPVASDATATGPHEGPWFMPLLAGYMVSRALDGSSRIVPLQPAPLSQRLDCRRGDRCATPTGGPSITVFTRGRSASGWIYARGSATTLHAEVPSLIEPASAPGRGTGAIGRAVTVARGGFGGIGAGHAGGGE